MVITNHYWRYLWSGIMSLRNWLWRKNKKIPYHSQETNMDEKKLTYKEKCEIIKETYDELLQLAQSILYNRADSEDVVQQACMLFFDGEKNPRSRFWLYPTTIHLAGDLLKRRRRFIPLDNNIDIESELLDPSEKLLDKNSRELLHQAISMLEDKYRDPINLFYIQGKTIKEGAKILEITPVAFSSRLHRARQKIKGFLT